MSDRKKIEEQILKDMRKMKARLKKHQEENHADLKEGEIPYDKKAARSAIEKFLQNHPNAKKFMSDLKEKMDK